MKNFLILILPILFFACKSTLQNPVAISNKDDVSEVKMVFTQYDQSKNIYYGKAIINNLSTNKKFVISSAFGFDVKNKGKTYNVYIDSIGTVLLDIYPLKSAEIDIVANGIPSDINFNDLEIELGFPTQDVIVVKPMKLK